MWTLLAIQGVRRKDFAVLFADDGVVASVQVGALHGAVLCSMRLAGWQRVGWRWVETHLFAFSHDEGMRF